MEVTDVVPVKLMREHVEQLQFAFHRGADYVMLRGMTKTAKMKEDYVSPRRRRFHVTIQIGKYTYVIMQYLEDDHPPDSVYRSWYNEGKWLLHVQCSNHRQNSLLVESFVLRHEAAWTDVPVYNADEHDDFSLRAYVPELTVDDFMLIADALRTSKEAA